MPLPFITQSNLTPTAAESRLEQEITVNLFLEHFAIRPKLASFSFLGEIVEAFALLPYENITKIIAKYGQEISGAKPRLRSPATVIADYIKYGSGGTCYSLTHTLATVLTFFGFDCQLMACDLGIHQNGHCALVATTPLGDSYFVDPGYLLSRPLTFHPGESSAVDNGFALVELRYIGQNRYSLLTTTDGDIKERYQLKARPLDRLTYIDYWYKSFDLPGLGRILITTCKGDHGRLYLHHNQLRHVTNQGFTKESIADNYSHSVQQIFGISAELVTEAKDLLHKWRLTRNKTN